MRHQSRRAWAVRPYRHPPATQRCLTRPSSSEGEMGDAARRRDRLHVVLLLKRLQTVPQPDAAAEQDRDLHDMQMVDEPGGEELAQHRRAPTDADVLTVCRLLSSGECIHQRDIEEMERRTAVHLQRRPRAMGQHVRRRVERRVLSPPSPPPPGGPPTPGGEISRPPYLPPRGLL